VNSLAWLLSRRKISRQPEKAEAEVVAEEGVGAERLAILPKPQNQNMSLNLLEPTVVRKIVRWKLKRNTHPHL
jgi:hypothetical protein